MEAVSNGQRGAVVERAPDGLLDQSIHLGIHGRGRLIQDQYLREERTDQRQRTGQGRSHSDLSGSHLAPSQQRTGHAQQLTFPHREVFSILHHLRLQLQGQLGHLRGT